MSNCDLTIAFIGAGKMATALAQGWIRAGLIAAPLCRASDPNTTGLADFTSMTGICATSNNAEAVDSSQVVVLAVKPQNMVEMLTDIRSSITAKHLVISIAAGVSIRQIREGLGKEVRIVRVMPNTPCLVQACAAGYAAGGSATNDDVELVDRLMNSVGRAVAVPESLLDAVTGLSGSGPAFVYTIIEALSDGGVLMGLPRDVATTLAAQTVYGSAKMVLETGAHPAKLKDQVTSPGGTTIAGLDALERAGVRSAMMEAVAAATRRAHELGCQEH